MKKLNLSLLAVVSLLCFSTYAQQTKSFKGLVNEFRSGNQKNNKLTAQSKTSANYAPGRSVNYYWSISLNSWLLNDTTVFSYNSQGLNSEILSRNGWPSNKKQITYDSKGRIIQELIQSWNNFSNQWQNSSRYVTLYDSKDNMIEYRSEQFNSSNNQWQINWGYRYIITYNTQNWMINRVSQNWNSGSSVWEDAERIIFSAHTASGTPTIYETQDKIGTNWVNNMRITDTYSIFGELIEEMVELWDGSAYKKDERYTNVSWHKWTGDMNTNAIGSYTMQVWGTPNANQWNTDGRYFSTYNSYGGSVGTFQTYTNSLWVNDERYSNFYDVNFNSTGYREESWITSSNSWNIVSEQKITHYYAFGGLNQITQSIWQQWNSASMTFENTKKEVYSDFVLISGLSSHTHSTPSEIQIFPNPFNAYCTLKFTNQIPTNEHTYSFQLYDAFGKLVSQTSINENETRIEKGNLARGIYFYSVMDNTSSVAKGKLVVE